jgi:hypothetical protein
MVEGDVGPSREHKSGEGLLMWVHGLSQEGPRKALYL